MCQDSLPSAQDAVEHQSEGSELSELEARFNQLRSGPSTVDEAIAARAARLGVRVPSKETREEFERRTWRLGMTDERSEEDKVNELLNAASEHAILSRARPEESNDSLEERMHTSAT